MENNNKQTKSTGKTALIVFLLLVTIVAVILATYAWAKYTETFNGEATANVAKWNVTATPGTEMFSKTFEHVVDKKMAPGTSGSLEASLDVTGTEVDVEYTITLVSVEATEGSVIPTNLVLKAADGTVIYKNKAIVTDTNGVIATGTIPAGSTGESAKVKQALSWEWPFETGTSDEEKKTNNIQDTNDGKTAGSFKVTYKIDAVQVEPTVATPAP